MYPAIWLSLATLLKFTHGSYIFYTVTSGDNQASIVWRYHITAAAIKLANPQLSDDDYALPGEVVQIPAACPIQANMHIAVPGDTMANIAKDNGISLTALQNSNPQITNPDVPNPGDCIELPGLAESTSSTSSPQSISSRPASSSASHVSSTTSAIAPPSGSSCVFTITASGGIACPAGELEDGQIRLNGSYPAANFTLSNGGITDSTGKGCIVTGPPETQFQCDSGKAPISGFAVGSSNTLTYNSSSTFYACPATDTEYNVYINPNFGQTKCFQIMLTANGCGTPPPSSTSVLPPSSTYSTPPASTSQVTSIQTVTESSTIWQTVTLGITAACSTTVSTSSTSSPMASSKNGTCPCESGKVNSTTTYQQPSLSFAI